MRAGRLRRGDPLGAPAPRGSRRAVFAALEETLPRRWRIPRRRRGNRQRRRRFSPNYAEGRRSFCGFETPDGLSELPCNGPWAAGRALFAIDRGLEASGRVPSAPNRDPVAPNRVLGDADLVPELLDRLSSADDRVLQATERVSYVTERSSQAMERVAYAPSRGSEAPRRVSCATDRGSQAMDRVAYAPSRGSEAPRRVSCATDRGSQAMDRVAYAPSSRFEGFSLRLVRDGPRFASHGSRRERSESWLGGSALHTIGAGSRVDGSRALVGRLVARDDSFDGPVEREHRPLGRSRDRDLPRVPGHGGPVAARATR